MYSIFNPAAQRASALDTAPLWWVHPPKDRAKKSAHDGGAPHGLAWTGGAGALGTGWKLVGVGVLTRDDVRGGAGLQVEGTLAL